jgi:serine kinase of HPr protein (carbohydrate metabolism regulator)
MSGRETSVHGTAFLIGETGLIAIGRSGAGKSGLVLGLAAALPDAPVRLVADDRVRLSRRSGRLIARPVAGFLGRIEVRGLGMAESASMPSAVIRGIVRLEPGQPERLPEEPFEDEEISGIPLPVLKLRACDGAAQAFIARWPYFRSIIEGRRSN